MKQKKLERTVYAKTPLSLVGKEVFFENQLRDYGATVTVSV